MDNQRESANAFNQLSLLKNGGQEERVGAFRPIHYIGSKLRILDSITSAIDEVAPGGSTVCDLFSGSGTVTSAVAQARPVVAVDIQEYSRVICSALLESGPISDQVCRDASLRASDHALRLLAAMSPLIDFEEECHLSASRGKIGPLCNLVQQGSIAAYRLMPNSVSDSGLINAIRATHRKLSRRGLQDSRDSLISRHFGGVYFSYSQAAHLDALLSGAADSISSVKSLLVAAALSTASSVVNTVGKHFAQPIQPTTSSGKPKAHLISKIMQDRQIPIFATYRDWLGKYRAYQPGTPCNLALRCDYADFLRSYSGKLGVVYADPPYTRDHYSRFYHVLETMCLRDDAGISLMRQGGEDHVSRGLYRMDRHQSPFSIRSKAPNAFRELLRGVRSHDVPLVLSYSPTTDYVGAQPRVMTIQAIRELALEHFASVDVRTVSAIGHSKLNSSENILGRSVNAERLLICTP
jgi:adenine-specific DNA-methyltransferase